MKNYKKGFTLIELLVVIAIIGILSSVVLASLNSARSKGGDAAVKNNLANIRAQAELVYDNNGGNYASPSAMCSDTTIQDQLDAASQAGAGNATSDKCLADSDSWVATAPYKTTANGYHCVDSTGKSEQITSAQNTAITTSNTLCP